MAKEKTTYSVPDDSPQMAMEPMAAYAYDYEEDEDVKMSAEEINALRQKEELTVEEMQALLLNMVDEEYSRP